MKKKLEFFRELFRYRQYMISSARANLKADVAGSKLNWLWWVLEPMGLMVMYAIIFGWLFQNSIEYFPVFIFIGSTSWAFFSKTITSSVSLMKDNEMLISRIYIPKYILLVVEMFIEGFKMLISFGLTALLMIVFRVKVSLTILWVIPICFVMMVFTFGLGCILLNLGVFVNDLGHAMRILMMIWMYFSGIFFDIETMVPEPFSTILLRYNFPAFIIHALRLVVINRQAPSLLGMILWLLAGTILSVFGLYSISKNENSYVKRI